MSRGPSADADSEVCQVSPLVREAQVHHWKQLLSQGLLFWLFKEGSKSVQVLFNGTEAVMVLALVILK